MPEWTSSIPTSLPVEPTDLPAAVSTGQGSSLGALAESSLAVSLDVGLSQVAVGATEAEWFTGLSDIRDRSVLARIW